MTAQPIAQIQPVESGGSWYVVSTDIDGIVVKRRGPFPSAEVAKTTAEKLVQAILKKQPGLRAEGFTLFVDTPHPTFDTDALIEDLARFADNVLSEAAVRRKHQLNDAVWEELGKDDNFVDKVEARKIARIRSGATKREKAQLLVVAAPDVMSGIMLDSNASPRHRVDAAKTLDQFATSGAEAAAAATRFEIVINLGADTERYSKSIEINPNDKDPYHADDAAPPIAAIAAKKSDGSDGQGHI